MLLYHFNRITFNQTRFVLPRLKLPYLLFRKTLFYWITSWRNTKATIFETRFPRSLTKRWQILGWRSQTFCVYWKAKHLSVYRGRRNKDKVLRLMNDIAARRVTVWSESIIISCQRILVVYLECLHWFGNTKLRIRFQKWFKFVTIFNLNWIASYLSENVKFKLKKWIKMLL